VKSASNFDDVLVLHNAVSSLPFRCGDQSPRISIVDKQTDGYVIAIRKKCCSRCIRYFLKVMDLSVNEDEKYLIIRTR
jgi:hypothetical protein